MGFLGIVSCFLCLHLAFGADIYRAAFVDEAVIGSNENKHESLIYEAAASNVDIFALPQISIESCGNEQGKYEQVLESISKAVKSSGVYAVVQVLDKCHGGPASRINLVFDRNGAIVTDKPDKGQSDGNNTLNRVSTDFGVTFGVLTEDDIIVYSVEEFGDIKNFIIFESSEKPFLFAKQFSTSWALAIKSNIITAKGIFGGRNSKLDSNIITSVVHKNGGNNLLKSLDVYPVELSSFPGEDMSQYIIKPLNLEATAKGYTSSVCHGGFCCKFDVKTSFLGSKDISYGLVAFDGMLRTGSHNIAVQSCAVVACAGIYKRSCFNGSTNKTDTVFEKLSINAFFRNNNNTQFPIFLPSVKTTVSEENFTFNVRNGKEKHVTAELRHVENVLSFGMLNRDYSKDFENVSFETDNVIDFSDYISIDNVQEFFDYVWIRLRVVVFIVSIYILEML